MTRLPLAPIIALALLAAAPAAANEPLPAALAELVAATETYPQDHAAAVALAWAAYGAERFEMSVGAWDRAIALSDGNLDDHLGRSLALLALGRVPDARADARSAVELNPDLPTTWARLAWTQRHPVGVEAPVYGQLAAASSYRRALVLEPEDALVRCGLAWVRYSLGDSLGAQARFIAQLMDDPSDDCAREGAVATAPTVRFGGAVSAAGLLYDGHSANTGGLSVLVQGGATFADVAFLELSGRFLGIDRGTVSDDYTQEELHARVGAAHAGFGGQLLVSVLHGSTEPEPAAVISGQVWGGAGVTGRIEGSIGSHGDGMAQMLGGGVRVPVASFLQLDARVRVSTWRSAFPVPDPITLQPIPAEAEGPFVNVQGSALLDIGRLHLELGGRGGTEVRPVRFDEPTVWNTTARPLAGAFVDGAVDLTEHFALSFGYEALSMRPTDGTSDDYFIHVLSLGFTVEGKGGLRR